MIYITAGRIEVEPLAVLKDGQIVLQLVNDRSQTCRRRFEDLSADGGFTELIGEICRRYEWGLFFVEGDHEPAGGTRARTTPATAVVG